jgi:hypothetical protein
MKLRDVQIAEDIMSVIEQEVTRIKENPSRETGDIILLERLSKTYSVIMASNRELVKSGMLGNLKLDESDDTSDSENDAEDD